MKRGGIPFLSMKVVLEYCVWIYWLIRSLATALNPRNPQNPTMRHFRSRHWKDIIFWLSSVIQGISKIWPATYGFNAGRVVVYCNYICICLAPNSLHANYSSLRPLVKLMDLVDLSFLPKAGHIIFTRLLFIGWWIWSAYLIRKKWV